jgi:hypothetical protein
MANNIVQVTDGWCYPSNASQKKEDSNILDNQGFSATRFTQSITRIALPSGGHFFSSEPVL